MMIPSPSRSALAAIVFMTALVVMTAISDDAMAQTMQQAQRNVAENVSIIPKFVAILGYAIGVFFSASGLLKLKDWIQDSSKNPLNPALFRIIVGALLISFMHVAIVVNTTFFSRNSAGDADTIRRAPPTNLNAFTKP